MELITLSIWETENQYFYFKDVVWNFNERFSPFTQQQKLGDIGTDPQSSRGKATLARIYIDYYDHAGLSMY